MTAAPAVVVVLTGGTARRLGGADKTALDVGGRSPLRRLLDDVAPLPTVVVGEPQDVGRDVVWTREEPAGGGPLAGVGAGVAAARAAHPAAPVVVVLAGDQPFAGPAVGALLAALDADAALDAALAAGPDGRPQPLLAAYRLAAVRERLTRDLHGRPARDLVAGLRTVGVAVSAATALDVDDADDLATARRVAAALSPPPRAPR
ncbi:nucleotidyltransferase family protein [Cellulomonas sp. zg-ZUI222]|uniref:Nucleotidyltransferase family protein n=1 Tax=Cellulomonas wangleii TaxID=2816956 RepID=A0ABX8D8Z9_9CELL|nr:MULTISPECIES: nucleotidyltransferase family protein [Cellulomonas]MBO0900463.1 nucleotidyltransferase family protein [Cellulomonas sp. zg-ZUI22]MBO0922707.1 nucleotidyltransferase family protein [Cellulomonas wangleii]MBO0926428.1 nucleotidyltransferase family protein [Cellulomonas wangleii]QVI63900.1 nucleotidyltransferase family protein [Cellulomonas wangleii]